jgi:hypothetical protein
MGSTLAIYPAQNVKLVQFQQSLIRRHPDVGRLPNNVF